jgi:hypothetical protein
MKKYEDFMRIRFSKNDAIEVFTGVGFKYDECKNMMPYSKILVQFNNENDIEKFEDDAPDINTFVISSSFEDKEHLQYILYAADENAYPDVCNILSNYDCDIYQFIIENETEENVNDFFNVD